ncbi:hypothetical protein EAI_02136, partial [Harpegnathos saltator]
FRCLERGHVRERCTSAVERNDLCYRCGNPGYGAKDCKAVAVHSAVCAEAGRSTGHKIGGAACKLSSKKSPKRGKRKGKAQGG